MIPKVTGVIAVLLVTSAAMVSAQSRPEATLLGGLALPVGDFGDDEGDDAGAARPGFALGGDLVVPLPPAGLGWMTTVAVMVNALDDDPFDEVIGEFGGDLDLGRYLVVPLLTGLRYRGALSPALDGYVLGQAGLAIFRAPDVELTSTDFSIEISPDAATSLAFGIGAGLIISNRFNVGLRYLSLAKPEFDATVRASVGGVVFEETEEVEQSVSELVIMLGIRL